MPSLIRLHFCQLRVSGPHFVAGCYQMSPSLILRLHPDVGLETINFSFCCDSKARLNIFEIKGVLVCSGHFEELGKVILLETFSQ